MSLTLSERETLEDYVAELAGRMRLWDWTIILSDEPSEQTAHGDDTAASVTTTYGRKRATLRLGKGWDSFSDEQKRHALTHELVHLHIEGMDDVMYYSVRPTLAPAVWEVVKEEFRRQLEFAVDGLADAVAPLMPALEGQE